MRGRLSNCPTVCAPRRASAGVDRWGIGQGEVEQNQRQSPRWRPPHADVVRFDVTMGDAVLLQPVGHDEQLFAEALQEIEGEPTLQTEMLGQCIGPGFDVDASHRHE
jgi:hypothetical protein